MPTDKPFFVPDVLDKTVIAIPLLDELEKDEKNPARDPTHRHPIIIDLNLEFAGGRKAAREEVCQNLIPRAEANVGAPATPPRIDEKKSRLSQQYLFGEMEAAVIRELVRLDTLDEKPMGSDSAQQVGGRRAIYRIWPDFEFTALTTRSISTVKADAARNSFAAMGEGIVWAVIDSGIDGTHPHFRQHQNLELPGSDTGGEVTSLQHRDFTRLDSGPAAALEDRFGHGTHVAGIIAGGVDVGEPFDHLGARQQVAGIHAEMTYRDQRGDAKPKLISPAPERISGMAPQCKLLSLKVLDDTGTDPGRSTPTGRSSNIIAALEYIQEINGYGRRLFVHGANLSVGYEFEPKWFACGQSPLCVEVDRLVRSGVVVIVAAGNTGYGITQINAAKIVASGLDLSINDPGNAELAITVGSTHREKPHVYGVSYFSSKGPTGDGRAKPDLIAPGEKIISCDSDQRRQAKGLATAASEAGQSLEIHARYREDSGTSMAAPHVSGVIAAFLSVRREFIGQPERVKEIFLSTATDLRRDRYFQGHGLVDLMRAIQSV